MAIAAIPPGLRDILPQEASELRAIEASLADTFARFGYGEVVVPTFEYYDLLAIETGELIRREMFKFFDQDGRIVALRPELTTPIARLAAQRLRTSRLPLRLYYLQNVFRQEPPQRGQQREFRQAGVELIGDAGSAADAEIVAMMAESLRNVGLADFTIGVGQVGYVIGLIDELDTGQDRKAAIREALLAKDLPRLALLTEPLGRAGEALRTLPLLRGENVFDRAADLARNDRSLAALDNLQSIVDLAREAGVGEKVVPDLGIVRNMDYYTGAIFEGYAGSIGFPISGGGRYDTLTAAFGWEQPATGFQHGVERLHIALTAEGSGFAVDVSGEVVLGHSGDAAAMFRAGRFLREQGLTVRSIFSQLDASAAPNLAASEGVPLVVAEAQRSYTLFLPSGDTTVGDVNAIMGALESYTAAQDAGRQP